MAKSRLKKYVHKDLRGRDVIIPNLYRDEETGIFYARLYHEGTVRSRSLETDVLTVAKTRMKDKLLDITKERPQKTQNKLVSDYFKDLWSIHQDQRGTFETTLKRYKTVWEKSLRPFWGDMAAHDISQQTVTAFFKWHKINRSTQLFNDIKLLKQILELMRSEGEDFPKLNLNLPAAESAQQKIQKGTYIKASEAHKIISATQDVRFKWIFEAAYTTGMRKGEIIKLRREHVNGAEIKLEARFVKTRKGRTVPLTKSLADELSRIMPANGWAFPQATDPSKHIPEQLVDRAWRISKEKAWIKRRIRFHDLRHTCATNLAQAGFDPIRASTFLGMSIKIFQDIYLKKDVLDLSTLVAATSLKHEED